MGNSVAYSGDLSFDMKKPPTPFHQQTPGGLQYGKTVIIEGEAKTGITGIKDRFSVNFKADRKDVAFHYDVRFWKDHKAVVINSRVKREWQNEERLINRFQKDALFRIQIQITESGFVVSDSNTITPFTFLYRHDLTPEKVKTITIKGIVQIKRVFYGVLTTFNESRLSEQQELLQQLHQFDQRLQPVPANIGIGLFHHHNHQHQNGTSSLVTQPSLQCCNHHSLSCPCAQQQTCSSCHQPVTPTLPSFQQQPEVNPSLILNKYSGNSLPNYQSQPPSISSNFHLPPPPYTSLQPSAPSVDDLSLENPLYSSNGNNGFVRSAVSAPPTPPPRPLRRRRTASMAPTASAKRVAPHAHLGRC